MKTSMFLVLVLLAIGSLQFGCAGSGDQGSSQTITNALGARSDSERIQDDFDRSGSSGTLAIGKFNPDIIGAVVSSGSTQSSFQKNAEDFLDSFITSDIFGTISGSLSDSSTGIRLRGRFVLPQGVGSTLQTIEPRVSNVVIEIYDSFMAQGTDRQDPIVIRFREAKRVERLGNQFKVTFEDEYQLVTFEGTLAQSSQSFVEGVVRFSNKQSASGSALKSGTLGTFMVPIQGFFYELAP